MTLAFLGGLVSPLFLLWGLAAAIPILIHLWHRHRYREVTWAAMHYLLAAMQRHSRRIRIEQLILLVLRVLILLTLALALSAPYINAGLSFGLGPNKQRTHYVLVLDGSYSMDYRADDQTHFQTAKAAAAQLIRDASDGDGFTLILMSDPPQVIIREPAFASSDVIDELESLALPHTGGELVSTLAEVERVVRAAKKQHRRLGETQVCWFTDMGRTTWDAVLSQDARRYVGRIDELANLVIFDVGRMEEQNFAITNLTASDTLVTRGRGIQVTAEVESFGSDTEAGIGVSLWIDGRQSDQQQIAVPAGGTATATFTARFDAAGEHMVEVRLEEDSIQVDNHRWLSVPVRDVIHVLCIEGKPGTARHVATALEPSSTEYRRVDVKIASEHALLESDLAQYPCLVLCNVPQFSRDEARQLKRYVASGGGLIVFLGDQVDLDNYNKLLGVGHSEDGLLPTELKQQSPVGDYALDPLEYQHPIVEPFRGHPSSGLLSTPIWRYIETESPEDGVEVALAFENGDAAIVTQSFGRGEVVLCTTAASGQSLDRSTSPPTPWTAMQTWPSFVPLIQEMLAAALRSQVDRRNSLVGQPLNQILPNQVADVAVDILTPQGKVERLKTLVDGDDGSWNFTQTWMSGIYQARLGPPVSRTELFAINVNTRESSLIRTDLDLLPSQFSTDLNAADDSRIPTPQTNRVPAYQYLLLFLLLLLMLESCLAWRFGQPSTRRGTP